MRFGCCADLDDIELVQEAGYDYIELPVSVVMAELPNAEFDGVRELVGSYDISPEVWNSLLPPDMKIVGNEVDVYRIERYMRTAFERIEELGGEIVVFCGGSAVNVPDGFSRDEARAQIVEFVTLAGRIAGTHGITVAVEHAGRGSSNIVNTLAEALDIVRAADHPFVKLAVDFHKMTIENEPIERVIDAGSEIVHIHIHPHEALPDALGAVGYDDRVSVICERRDFPAECGAALDFLRGLQLQ
ncbi:MAG: sugar phosphate isomerase/epimerase family protein [Armatimonadota bacterium]|nr:sugar phosphate isomerase/epimerase [bacterium]